MELTHYQQQALETADYPNFGDNLLYPALGLAGESGETADKVKKYWRNYGHTSGATLSREQRLELIKEIGDVMWYCAALAEELGSNLEEIAHENLKKLRSRAERGVIKSEGDNR